MGYDSAGDLTSITDANGNTTSYTYDAMDRRASRKDALGAAAAYAYDGNGNLTRFTDRRGTVTVYQYDGLNRRVFAGYRLNGSGQYQRRSPTPTTPATGSPRRWTRSPGRSRAAPTGLTT